MTTQLRQNSGNYAKNTQRHRPSISPQIRKAIELLEKSQPEIQTFINQEFESNPMLEKCSDDGIDDGDTEGINENEFDGSSLPSNTDGQLSENIAWDNYHPNDKEGWPATSDGDQKLPIYERAAFIPSNNLHFHLIMQLALSNFNIVQKDIVSWIIGNIDDNGYLKSSAEEICQDLGRYQTETVSGTIQLMQGFDPKGIASKNARECLLIQSRSHMAKKGAILEKIISEHWNDVLNKKVDKITKALGISRDDVQVAIEDIASKLNPRPGLRFKNKVSGQNLSAFHIIPDIYVSRDGDGFRIKPENDYSPVRINRSYEKLLEDNGRLTKKERQYILEKRDKAKFFIRSIEQRQKTIHKVTESVIGFQREFFNSGAMNKLRPLISRDVAEQIDLNESTVRRTTKGKYIDTPYGIFELRFFFDKEGIDSLDGQKVSSKGVKEIIRKIIQSEQKKKPFRDQEIANILRNSFAINIARRTLMKYRDSIGFLPARLRKWPC